MLAPGQPGREGVGQCPGRRGGHACVGTARQSTLQSEEECDAILASG